MGGFEIGLEYRVVECASVDETAGIDVDRRHGFRLVDNQITSRFQIDPSRECKLDFFFDVIQIEKRAIAFIAGYTVKNVRGVDSGELLQFGKFIMGIDQNSGGVFVHEVAQNPF